MCISEPAHNHSVFVNDKMNNAVAKSCIIVNACIEKQRYLHFDPNLHPRPASAYILHHKYVMSVRGYNVLCPMFHVFRKSPLPAVFNDNQSYINDIIARGEQTSFSIYARARESHEDCIIISSEEKKEEEEEEKEIYTGHKYLYLTEFRFTQYFPLDTLHA